MLWLILLSIFSLVQALDNGLALTPPMGWRSWNYFGETVTQSKLEYIMDAMAKREYLIEGEPTSLCDLGYCTVGLDDNWQSCNNKKFHNLHGQPMINLTRFPNMRGMNEKAHGLGLSTGFYLNNCICTEKEATPAMYLYDVYTTVGLGFDGVKIDECGMQKNLTHYANLFNKTGYRVLIENCHWGIDVPTKDSCPWHTYRTSGDILASYGSVVRNLQTVTAYARDGLSRPGCWAYPDMLEIGCASGTHKELDVGLNFVESRSHFGAWCIVSSPLTLSFDVSNKTLVEQYWPIISNREAIRVNQAWYGHSGSPFKEANETVHLINTEGLPPAGKMGPLDVPAWQYFYKPMDAGKVAVFLMNHADHPVTVSLAFSEVPGLLSKSCTVFDVWQQKDLGRFSGELHVNDLPGHDSFFLILETTMENVN